MHVQPVTALQGRVMLSGDKSISHRALMLGALAGGVTRIANLPQSDDLAATRRCLEALGVPIERNGGGALYVRGGQLKEAAAPLDCGGSGTTIRLMAGLLANLFLYFSTLLENQESHANGGAIVPHCAFCCTCAFKKLNWVQQ